MTTTSPLARPPEGFAFASQAPVEPRSGPVTAAFVREIIRRRAARSAVASADYFTDPPWDILLDLTAARLEGRTVPVRVACRAANVSEAAATRWINAMVRDKLLDRLQDDGGVGHAHVTTSAAAHARMLDYLTDAALALRSMVSASARDAPG